MYGETPDLDGYSPEPFTISLGTGLHCHRGIRDFSTVRLGEIEIIIPHHSNEKGMVNVANARQSYKHQLRVHVDSVTGLFEVSGRRVASFSKDGSIKLWHPDALLEHFKDRKPITCITVVNSEMYAIGTRDGEVIVVNVIDGRMRLLYTHDGCVNRIVTTQSGRLLSGGSDGQIVSISLHTGVAYELYSYFVGVKEIICNSVTGRVAIGFGDGMVATFVILQLENDIEVRGDVETCELWQHPSQMAFLPDAVVAVGTSGGVVLWDPKHSVLKQVISSSREVDMPWVSWVWCVISTSRGRVYCSGGDGIIQTWQANEAEATVIGRHTRGVRALELVGETSLLSIGDDDCIRCWSQLDNQLRWHRPFPQPVCIKNLDSKVFVATSRQGWLVVGDVSDGRFIAEYRCDSVVWEVSCLGKNHTFLARLESGEICMFCVQGMVG